jgi:hypothetical protein
LAPTGKAALRFNGFVGLPAIALDSSKRECPAD